MSILQKRSLVTGSLPTTASLLPGELAMNVPDGRIYLRKSGSGSDTIQSAITTGANNSGSVTLTGPLTLSGSMTALATSGDTMTVNADTFELTGSFTAIGASLFSGSVAVTGSMSVTNGITSSLSGTSSWSVSSSRAVSASYSDVNLSSSYALTSRSSSYALSSSYSFSATSASYASSSAYVTGPNFSTRKLTTVTLGSTINNYVEFLNIDGGANGGYNLIVSINNNLAGTNIQTNKVYVISSNYGVNPNWQVVSPVSEQSSNGASGAWELLVFESGGSITFRLRNKLGFAGTSLNSINVYNLDGNTTLTYTQTNTTGTDATAYTLSGGSPLMLIGSNTLGGAGQVAIATPYAQGGSALTVSGSTTMSGSLVVTNGITGSLSGTATSASRSDLTTNVYTPSGTANRILYQSAGGGSSTTTTDGALVFNSGTGTLSATSMGISYAGTFKSSLDGSNNISMHDGAFGIIKIRNNNVDKITINRDSLGGEILLSGSVISTNGFTGSLAGTSSYALTASYALTSAGGGGGGTVTNNVTAATSLYLYYNTY